MVSDTKFLKKVGSGVATLGKTNDFTIHNALLWSTDIEKEKSGHKIVRKGKALATYILILPKEVHLVDDELNKNIQN